MAGRACCESFALLVVLTATGCGGGQKSPALKTTPSPAAPGAEISTPAEQTNSTATAEQQGEKKPRDQIYIEEANGEQLVAAAVERAKSGGKHVLIEWGGNWCGWCYKLHDVFHEHAVVHPILEESFELVLIDSTKNRELMQTYGGKDRQFSYPHLTVLDAEGQVLTNQNTEPLEEGRGHDPVKVAALLKEWSPKR